MSLTIVIGEPGLRLRPEYSADHGFLRRLFDNARAEQFARAGLSDQMLNLVLAQQFRLQAQGHVRQYPAAKALIVERDQAAVGRLLVDCTEERWHVVDIALMAEGRGQGIGTAIMRGLETAAFTAGVGRLTLLVLESNVGARRLYARLGFAGTGTTTASGYNALSKRLDS